MKYLILSTLFITQITYAGTRSFQSFDSTGNEACFVRLTESDNTYRSEVAYRKDGGKLNVIETRIGNSVGGGDRHGNYQEYIKQGFLRSTIYRIDLIGTDMAEFSIRVGDKVKLMCKNLIEL